MHVHGNNTFPKRMYITIINNTFAQKSPMNSFGDLQKTYFLNYKLDKSVTLTK